MSQTKPEPTLMDCPFFIDWITISQSFDYDLPLVSAGVVWSVNVHGEVEWQTVRAATVEGSHDTSIQVRCDGRTVRLSGNVSRFGRSDNVFGYDLAACIRRCSNIVAQFGLPPFTAGQKYYRHTKPRADKRFFNPNGTLHAVSSGHSLAELAPAWTGARISRLDLTANFETGSMSNARAYLEWLGTQQTSARIKVGVHGDGETVDWGRGSRRIYSKAYLKAPELLRHNGPRQLIEYCEDAGVVRFEVTVKANQLQTMGCDYLGGLDMGQLVNLFDERRAVLTRAEHTHDDLEQLPNTLRRTARDWLAGDDLRGRMSLATFKRHRAGLLPYGIDIAVKRNVVEFKPRIRVIEVRPAVAPSWYDFNERLAAA
ncbi:phage/plasmid replication domain-containing protein [Comamonas testosteroni]|uniref:phage/plasmid replication domain-containing protein n=1 Tax=Comamonas testosteroni TaxID=285 RepID=UPI002E1441F8|nr:phage/plasmid replication protein [Comamonas testosteroni]WQD44428.1 phage/plasmid replication protein [Comamonas testosteroni]